MVLTVHFYQNIDGFFIGVYQEDLQKLPVHPIVKKYFSAAMHDYVQKKMISTKEKTVTVLPTLHVQEIQYFYFVGLGSKKKCTRELLKESFAVAVKASQAYQAHQLVVDMQSFSKHGATLEETATDLGEAFERSAYRFSGYQTTEKSQIKSPYTIDFYVGTDSLNQATVRTGFRFGRILGNGQNSARTLVNMPSNYLTVDTFCQYCKDLAKAYDLRIQIYSRTECEEMGMGAFLAVNQGSSIPAQLVVLEYQGLDEWKNPIAFIGKSVIFDTGGYSLKSSAGMLSMKTDMGGGAAVLGAMEIIGKLKPKANVLAVLPVTDNVVNSYAYKPDDVITSMSGKTIEITNTDAEGRLTLCDAITFAKKQGATELIDVATLTGAMMIALGKTVTGMMTNNLAFLARFQKAAESATECVWHMPIFEEHRNSILSSKIADMVNTQLGNRYGGGLAAGAFLEQFAGDTPWIHLDIAGPSTTKGTALDPAGGTGVMARSLAYYVLLLSQAQSSDEKNIVKAQ